MKRRNPYAGGQCAPTIAELRADLAESQGRLYGKHRNALNKAMSELEVQFCTDRLRAALKRQAHPYVQPTIEQILTKLHASGVEIAINGRTA